MNKVILTGRLTNDLELRHSKEKGISYTKGTIAVNDRIKDTTYFIPFVIFNKNAEAICEFAKKGSNIGIFGKLERNAYVNEQKNITEYNTTVLAESFEFINSSKKKNNDEVILKRDEDLELISSENLPF